MFKQRKLQANPPEVFSDVFIRSIGPGVLVGENIEFAQVELRHLSM